MWSDESIPEERNIERSLRELSLRTKFTKQKGCNSRELQPILLVTTESKTF